MKIKNRIVLMLAAAIALSGCTSQPEQINHYLLHSSSTQGIELKNTDRVIAIQAIKLAEYLQSKHIVMQLSNKQLQFSHHHRWAESLQSAIGKTLRDALNQHSKQFHFINAKGNNNEEQYSLSVNLDHFLIHQESHVLIAGDYSLLQLNNPTVKRKFHFNFSLEEDGYAHSVEKLRYSIDALAKMIVSDEKRLQEKLSEYNASN